MKRQIIIVIIILISIFLGFCFLTLKGCQIEAFINWNIYLSGVKEEKVIYDTFFRDGDTISILTISNSHFFKKNAML